jgi:hypothetical protein
MYGIYKKRVYIAGGWEVEPLENLLLYAFYMLIFFKAGHF